MVMAPNRTPWGATYLALYTLRNPWVTWIMAHDPAILAGTPQDPTTGEAIGPRMPLAPAGRVVRCGRQRRLRGPGAGQLALDLGGG